LDESKKRATKGPQKQNKRMDNAEMQGALRFRREERKRISTQRPRRKEHRGHRDDGEKKRRYE